MEKFSDIEGETTTYNPEAIAASAQKEAHILLEERMPGIMNMPSADKIPVLEELISELSVMVDGTDIPQHNENRHVVEALARLLSVEKSRQQFDSLMTRYPELA